MFAVNINISTNSINFWDAANGSALIVISLKNVPFCFQGYQKTEHCQFRNKPKIDTEKNMWPKNEYIHRYQNVFQFVPMCS